MSRSSRSARMFWLYRLQNTAPKHPEVSINFSAAAQSTVARGMGHSPMKRSGTDCDFSGVRALGALDAAAAVRLAVRSFAP